MVEAFGSAARDVAPYLEDVPAILVGEDAIGLGYFRMAELRKAGETFAGMLFMDEPRALASQRLIPQVAGGRSRGELRRILETLGTGALRIDERLFLDGVRLEPEVVNGARDCARLCDVLIVRSLAEYERHRSCFEWEVPFERWFAPRALGAWSYRGAKSDRIVVWACGRPVAETAFFVAALEPLHADLIVVADGTEPEFGRARYMDQRDAGALEAAAGARCVVDASICDPSWSFAFAAHGVPLVYSTTSGSDEWIRGGAAYLPWSNRSLIAAVLAAIAGGTTMPRRAHPGVEGIGRSLERARAPAPRSKPLVSVVVPTFNRRSDLVDNSLASLRAQRYANLEIVVVNDGGESVADLAELDPRIKVYDRDVNVGFQEACNFGFARATGTYVQMLADDDALFPDHILRLVEVLERTGGDVVHGDTLMRYETKSADGTVRTIAYNASVFVLAVELEQALSSSPVAGQGLFMRLERLLAVGGLRNLLLADQELQIRLLKEVDFLHVPRFTSEFLIRSEGHNLSRKATRDVPAGLQAMYEAHPSDDGFVRQFRERALNLARDRKEGFTFDPVVKIAGFEI